MRYPILLCAILMACSTNDPEPDKNKTLYFPPTTGTTWQTEEFTALGWNEAELANLYDFLEDNNTRAFIVLKDGKIAIEKYFGKQFDGTTNFGVTSNWYWASAGKTLTAAIIGIAEAQGKINLQTKTSTYLGTGWTNLTLAQENNITVLHQLTMTTGLDDGVVNRDCTDPSCLIYKAVPGSRWAYHNAPYTLLDGVIANATGKTLNNYLSDELKSITGMDGQYIQTGENNVYYSTPRSMARFGLLLLNKGKWGQTQVVPESFLNLMITSSQSMNPSYGYLTWLNGKSSYLLPAPGQININASITPNAPIDMFAAMGKNGQLINVIPSKQLVVIRVGDAPDTSLVPYTFQNDLWTKLNEIIP